MTPRFYGQGTGPLVLDDLVCLNTEQKLIDCAHSGLATPTSAEDTWITLDWNVARVRDFLWLNAMTG